MPDFYLSNAIPYANARPHIGHFLEFILADAIARYRRLCGDRVYFGLGSDENGQKMWQTARDANREPLDLATENAKHFQDLKDTIGISYDGFVRTTSDEHRRASQALWRRLDANGDLQKRRYHGLYCVGCESFKTDKDLVNGFCPNHLGKPLKEVAEENYFFTLTKYEDRLRELISSGKLRIVPEFRKNELLNFLGDGLEDVSFSRPKSSLPWGIEVPGDPDHVMYVWCDALTNYLTHAGYPDRTPLSPWPTDLHVIGKDITRFHAIIWQAMLLSAGLEPSRAIFVHEFVTMDGQKMSKTLGNVVDPYEVMQRYGSEALRFYLLSESVHGNDLDFTWPRFHAVYESQLRNGLGNMVNRVLSLLKRYENGILQPRDTDRNLHWHAQAQQAGKAFPDAQAFWPDYRAQMDNLDFAKAIFIPRLLLGTTEEFLAWAAPWKTDDSQWRSEVLTLCGLNLINVAVMLLPVIPTTAGSILQAFGHTDAKDAVPAIATPTATSDLPILFPPVEPKPSAV